MATPMSYCLLDAEGVIANVIAWDGVTPLEGAKEYTTEKCIVGRLYRIGLKVGEDYPPEPDPEPLAS